jgi:hypothetical protein
MTTATKTIDVVLREFLDEHSTKLSVRTMRQYESVILLLTDCINGEGWNGISHIEKARVAERREDPDMEWNFCALFGPEYIVGCYGEFLGYFMVRKVVAGKELMRAAGTVTKKLAVWLAEKGYIAKAQAEEGAKTGAEAARSLPMAQEISDALDASIVHDLEEASETEDGHFSVTRRLGNKLWFSSMAGQSIGPITVSEWIADGLKVGWSISGMVGKVKKAWVFLEVWNIYPM